MMEKDKIVRFVEYCHICEHYKFDENVEPCASCLENPTNQGSRQPLYFKERLTSSRLTREDCQQILKQK